MSTERHFDPAGFANLLDPERAEWTRPAELLQTIGVKPGMVCADVGCGPGFFTLPIAATVAPGGRVFGTDDSQEMLDALAERAAAEGLAETVVPHLADAAGTGLAQGSLDLVFCAFVYHEVASTQDLIDEFLRILKPGGRMAIIDWRMGAPWPPGPPDDHRLTLEQMLEPFQRRGLDVERPGFSDLFHVLLARKPSAARRI